MKTPIFTEYLQDNANTDHHHSSALFCNKASQDEVI